jgi:magnesium transporter
VFITAHALVTVRHDDDFDMDAVVERWDSSMELAKSGVAFLLHGLVDYIVDGHFDAIQTLDDQIESLEDLMFADRPDQADIQRRALALRESLVAIRRVMLPMREVVNTIIRRDLHLIDEPMQPYFQDVYDHVLRVTEWTESLRDLVTTLRETQLNLQSNRLNAIMKKVTGWAAIIAVPTAITGFYGQNIPFPGSQQSWGFGPPHSSSSRSPAVCSCCSAAAIGFDASQCPACSGWSTSPADSPGPTTTNWPIMPRSSWKTRWQ